MKVAIIHDYFNQNGGAEKVVETLLEIYPNADIITSVYIPENFVNSKPINDVYLSGKVKTSFMNSIFVKDGKATKYLKYSKHLYWLYPFAMHTLQASNYDLVIVSSTYCAKNIRLKNIKKLVHYCHSPTRFLHNLITEKDHSTLPLWQRVVSKVLLNPPLYIMDMAGVNNLIKNQAIWIANSDFIKETISDVYHVSSDVIYPPVEIDKFSDVIREEIEDKFYLCHGRISFHKRLDIAILSCLDLNRKLIISGQSALDSDIDNLKALIPDEKRDLITFLGRTDDEQLKLLVATASAMLFPGKEDAGIAPIEMLAAGLPVIAFNSGGAKEYIQDEVNGIFFDPQDVQHCSDAIIRFENTSLDIQTIKGSIDKFSKQNFIKQFLDM
jgi:glycosyltransferase involved in cell wall biosynthesis